jgi:hypothetical protein
MLDEISLIGSQMFSFIDKRLQIIKHKHNSFLWNLNVLIIGDFHQVPLVRDSWVFQPIDEGFNFLGINFWWKEKLCYELCLVMQQQDTQFVEIFNRFKKVHQTQQDIDITNYT